MTNVPDFNGPHSEARRLEDLWSGDFGNAYLERNRAAGEKRRPFWAKLLAEVRAQRVLEVGCNLGGNLGWIADHLPAHQIYGIDVNERALAEGRRRLPGVNLLWGRASDLPFRDGWFDLVFTSGVLIHQPEDTVQLVMAEIVRCSRQFVLSLEYFADLPTEIPYRGQRQALIKRDFGRVYRELFPDLSLRKTGLLTADDGWDCVTYWLFEREHE